MRRRDRHPAFLEGLQQLGWTPGRTWRIEVRWGRRRRSCNTKICSGARCAYPDVLVAGGGVAAEVLLKVTHSTPIVFVIVPDPVGSGFVESLSQPGANATGFMMFEYNLCGKWLELLKEIAPNVTHVAVLREAGTAEGIGQFAVIQSVAPSVGIEVSPIDLRGAVQIERVIATFAHRSNGAIILTASNRGSQCQFDHRSSRTLQAASDLHSTTLCNCRWIDLLWAEFSGPIPTRG